MDSQNYGKIVFSLLTKKLPFEFYYSVSLFYYSVSLTFIEKFYRNSGYNFKHIRIGGVY